MTRLALLLLTLTPAPSFADLVVTQLGDSVANAAQNRVTATAELAAAGIAVTWNGDQMTPPTYAKGGWRYDDMLEGRSEPEWLPTQKLGPGLIELVEGGLQTDVLYILGGYNNVAGGNIAGAIDDLRALLDYAEQNVGVPIYLSNVTMFTGPWAHRQPEVEELNALIDIEVAQRDSVHLVDNYSTIGPGGLLSDGLHLNHIGQMIAGQNFANAVAVPEPSAWLVGLVLLLLLLRHHHRQQKQSDDHGSY